MQVSQAGPDLWMAAEGSAKVGQPALGPQPLPLKCSPRDRNRAPCPLGSHYAVRSLPDGEPEWYSRGQHKRTTKFNSSADHFASRAFVSHSDHPDLFCRFPKMKIIIVGAAWAAWPVR